jgi:membrane-associated phospholipid phosphatase
MYILENIPFMLVGAAAVLTVHPIVYLFSLIVSLFLNRAIKNNVQQKRPSDCPKFLRKSFGMPSGHTQTASFATAFVWQSISNVQKLVLAALVVATMVQRVVSKAHTVAQVGVGLLVGSLLGVVTSRFASKMPRKDLLGNTY